MTYQINNMKDVTIFDNKGKTLDRYTILDRKTGDVYGCSDDPFHPMGVGQFSHNVADVYWVIAYGYNWRERINAKRAIKDACVNYVREMRGTDIGVIVNNKQRLPERVKQYIKQVTE